MSLVVCLKSTFGAHRSQVGGSPTASYLFCLAKKGNPKKATTLPLPFGCPIVRFKNGESQKLAFGSDI